MVDYAQFFVDPRPYSNDALGNLARTMYARDRMAQDQAQEDEKNRMALAKYQSDLQQQAFQNQMSLANLGIADRNAAVGEGNLGLRGKEFTANQEEAATKERTRVMGEVYGLMTAVKDPATYEVYKQALLQKVENGELPPDVIKRTPPQFNFQEFGMIRDSLGGMLEKEMWSAPAPIKGGRGALGITNSKTGETRSVVGQAPQNAGEGAGGPKPMTTDQRISLAETLYKDATRGLYDEELGGYRQGPAGEEDIYEKLDKRMLDANVKDREDIAAGKAEFPVRTQKIIEEIAQVNKDAESWQAEMNSKADPADPKNAYIGGDPEKGPRIINFFRNGKWQKYVSNGKSWIPYEEKKKK